MDKWYNLDKDRQSNGKPPVALSATNDPCPLWYPGSILRPLPIYCLAGFTGALWQKKLQIFQHVGCSSSVLGNHLSALVLGHLWVTHVYPL